MLEIRAEKTVATAA